MTVATESGKPEVSNASKRYLEPVKLNAILFIEFCRCDIASVVSQPVSSANLPHFDYNNRMDGYEVVRVCLCIQSMSFCNCLLPICTLTFSDLIVSG